MYFCRFQPAVFLTPLHLHSRFPQALCIPKELPVPALGCDIDTDAESASVDDASAASSPTTAVAAAHLPNNAPDGAAPEKVRACLTLHLNR